MSENYNFLHSDVYNHKPNQIVGVINQLTDSIDIKDYTQINTKKIKEALEFYQYYANAIQQDQENLNTDGLMATITVLEMDAGNRAKEALNVLS